MQVTTTGIVIRSKTSGDDRFVTILTPDYGVLDAVARSAGTPRGKLTGATELFCYSRMVLFRYRGSNTIDSAEAEESFFDLRKDLEGLALASYFAQVACELAPREEEARMELRLLLNCLYLTMRRAKPLAQIKSIFELRLLTLAGFMPDLTGCCRCGALQESGMLFSVEEGTLYCCDCNKPPDATVQISAGVLAAMRHIIYSDFEKLFSFMLSQESLKELENLCERYLLTQMRQNYGTLDFYHSVAAADGGASGKREEV